MADGDVHFLNPRRGFRENAQTKITPGSHLATRFTGQPDHPDMTLVSRFNAEQDVPAVATGGDGQQHVAGRASAESSRANTGSNP